MNFFKNRTLRFDILTIFLFLISITSIVIISFTYERNIKSILQFSRVTIDQVGELIGERINCLFREMEKFPETTRGILQRNPVINGENKPLIARFLDEVQYNKKLFSVTAGAPDGGFITVLNLNLTGRGTIPKNAPKDAVYALIIIDGNKPKAEEWRYYNSDREMIFTETVPGLGFDPRTRPWYTGAEKTGKLYWSEFFPLIYAENKPGLSISDPVYSSDHKLIGVLATILYYDEFSEFLADQKVGKNGQIFILNSSGTVVIPKQPTDVATQKIIALARADRSEDQVIQYQGDKYLTSVHSLPVSFGRNWQVLIIVPFLDFFSGIIQTEHQVVLISLVILIFAVVLIVFFSNHISKPIVILAEEINKIKQLELDSNVRVKSNIKEINLLDSSIAAMRSALRSFSRYVPKEIVKKLMQRGQDIALGGEKREITLFFTDVNDLTPIAERLPLETLNAILAEYFDGMSKVILKDLGTIDKYIGDSILAYWGAPDPVDDHATKACIAALECQEFVTQFNQKQGAKGMPELTTRIGINSGDVIAGNIGTMERMNYTVMGDVVNAAERLEKMNKAYRTKIIIGEEVVTRIGDQFLIRPLDLAEVKGRKGKIRIYELLARKQDATAKEKELADLFTPAYEAYHRGSLSESKALFTEVLRKFPDDCPTQLYLKRIVTP